MKLKLRLIVFGLLLVCLLGGSCSTAPELDDGLNSIVKDYRFNYVKWELRAFAYETRQWLSGNDVENPTDTVIEYFSLREEIRSLEREIANDTTVDTADLEAELSELEEQRAALTSSVEQIIADQIKEVLAEEGIYNPWGNSMEVTFPSVNFIMSELPYLLVISPRDHIESLREISLRGNLTPEEIEAIEAEADELGVSSLVVSLGGAGALYPTLVTNSASLSSTINTAVEEWLHQYLAFKPMGFRYILDLTGIHRDYDIATLNETLAGIVSGEIGTIVYQKYYAAYETSTQTSSSSGFDFNQEMREIRTAVDDYLARGEIEQAEAFMEEKRDYLQSMGYYIRKLNQAYFAFHGAYADEPTSVSPIGEDMRTLREQSDSLRDFLETAAELTSHEELQELLVANPE